MKIKEYYKSHPEYEFFIASYNLFMNSGLREIIEKGKNGEQNKFYYLTIHISKCIDEFNFMIVRLTVALELSLKGIAIKKKYNIFKESYKIRKISDSNLSDFKVYELNFFLDNLKLLLNNQDCDKYLKMMRFFQKQRNDYIHFAERRYTKNNTELMKNFILMEEYFKKIVIPLKQKASEREAN